MGNLQQNARLIARQAFYEPDLELLQKKMYLQTYCNRWQAEITFSGVLIFLVARWTPFILQENTKNACTSRDTSKCVK